VSSGVLIDTNVLIYSTGIDGSPKAVAAYAVLKALSDNESGTVSTQVLSEYANTMLRLYSRAARQDVAHDLDDLRGTWPVLTVTETTVIDAVRGALEHGMSFYDAQLWATARLAGIDVVLTEDFTDGRVVEGVRFVDPFSPTFDPRDLSICPRPVLEYVCLWGSLTTPVAGARSRHTIRGSHQ
jgi:predicted nucleic acid-binding protein